MMPSVKDILNYLETLAPAYMKESWDNVGLLCGDEMAPVQTVLVALDPFEGVCREAKAVGADLLITHHPLIFQPCKTITTNTGVGRSILTLCAAGISAINAHTNLDCANGGVNTVLAQTLGLSDIRVITSNGTDVDGQPWGLLRMGTFDAALPDFLAHVKQALGCEGLRYVDGGKDVHQVAVGGGACAGGIREAFDAGCDTFVTADVKYNQFWDARDLGMNLIDAGHFQTENPVVAVLAAKIAAEFPDLTVKISQTHEDCMKFY